MTEQQVFDKLTSNKKWYLHGKNPMTQQAASAFTKSYHEETARHETIQKVFKQFGYVVDSPTTYKHEG